MRIQAAVATAPQQPFSLETLDIEPPRDDEVLIRIKGVGICHTDLVARDQLIPIPLPAVLGHEGAGIVESVGSAVSTVKPGDTVVLSFLSCGHCPRCDEGKTNYCQQFPVINYAGTRLDGSHTLSRQGEPVSGCFFGQSSFASHALANVRNVVKVSSRTPLHLLGPLGCGIQTGAGSIINALKCQAGSSLLIFGAGTVGLSAVMAAKLQQCQHIIVVDPMPARTALALELGATQVIDSNDSNVAAQIRLYCPQGVDYAFDTSGSPQVIETAIACLGSFGLLGLVGVPPHIDASAAFNIAQLITYGLQIKGIIIGDSNPQQFIPQLIELYEQGLFPFDKLIKTFPLENINDAIDAQHNGECVKAVLLIDT